MLKEITNILDEIKNIEDSTVSNLQKLNIISYKIVRACNLFYQYSFNELEKLQNLEQNSESISDSFFNKYIYQNSSIDLNKYLEENIDLPKKEYVFMNVNYSKITVINKDSNERVEQMALISEGECFTSALLDLTNEKDIQIYQNKISKYLQKINKENSEADFLLNTIFNELDIENVDIFLSLILGDFELKSLFTDENSFYSNNIVVSYY